MSPQPAGDLFYDDDAPEFLSYDEDDDEEMNAQDAAPCRPGFASPSSPTVTKPQAAPAPAARPAVLGWPPSAPVAFFSDGADAKPRRAALPSSMSPLTEVPYDANSGAKDTVPATGTAGSQSHIWAAAATATTGTLNRAAKPNLSHNLSLNDAPSTPQNCRFSYSAGQTGARSSASSTLGRSSSNDPPGDRPERQSGASAKSLSFATNEPLQPLPKARGKVRGDYEFLTLIGEGSLGKVYEAVLRGGDGERMAIKTVKKSRLVHSPALLKATRHEAKILYKRRIAQCKNILTLYASFQDEAYLYYVFEYLEGGSLTQTIKRLKDLEYSPCVPLDLVRLWMSELLTAVWTLSRERVVHRDIKPDNVLLHEGHVRLIDLNNAVIVDGVSTASAKAQRELMDKDFGGTLAYWPPERVALIANTGTPTAASASGLRSSGKLPHRAYICPGTELDLWGLGCVMYQMLTGQGPFCRPNHNLTIERILRYTQKPTCLEFPSTVGPLARDLCLKLLDPDPMTRAEFLAEDFNDLLSHPFFAGVSLSSNIDAHGLLQSLLRTRFAGEDRRHVSPSILEFTPEIGQAFRGRDEATSVGSFLTAEGPVISGPLFRAIQQSSRPTASVSDCVPTTNSGHIGSGSFPYKRSNSRLVPIPSCGNLAGWGAAGSHGSGSGDTILSPTAGGRNSSSPEESRLGSPSSKTMATTAATSRGSDSRVSGDQLRPPSTMVGQPAGGNSVNSTSRKVSYADEQQTNNRTSEILVSVPTEASANSAEGIMQFGGCIGEPALEGPPFHHPSPSGTTAGSQPSLDPRPAVDPSVGQPASPQESGLPVSTADRQILAGRLSPVEPCMPEPLPGADELGTTGSMGVAEILPETCVQCDTAALTELPALEETWATLASEQYMEFMIPHIVAECQRLLGSEPDDIVAAAEILTWGPVAITLETPKRRFVQTMVTQTCRIISAENATRCASPARMQQSPWLQRVTDGQYGSGAEESTPVEQLLCCVRSPSYLILARIKRWLTPINSPQGRSPLVSDVGPLDFDADSRIRVSSSSQLVPPLRANSQPQSARAQPSGRNSSATSRPSTMSPATKSSLDTPTANTKFPVVSKFICFGVLSTRFGLLLFSGEKDLLEQAPSVETSRLLLYTVDVQRHPVTDSYNVKAITERAIQLNSTGTAPVWKAMAWGPLQTERGVNETPVAQTDVRRFTLDVGGADWLENWLPKLVDWLSR